ncbi:unnamed protein product, partial [marine sediment metagenome]
QVPTESIPTLLLPIWGYIVAFFALAPVITVIAFSRNILGYLISYFKTNHEEEYDLNKLGKTLTLYIGILAGMLSAATTLLEVLPVPYNEYVATAIAIGASIIVVLDLVKKQLADLGQAIRA